MDSLLEVVYLYFVESAFHRIFQDILNFIESKIGRGRAKKVMEISLDKKQVIKWKQDIDHSLNTFNVSDWMLNVC